LSCLPPSDTYSYDTASPVPVPTSSNKKWGWGVLILPYLENQAWARLVNTDLLIQEGHNPFAVKTIIPLYLCPSAGPGLLVFANSSSATPGDEDVGETNYAATATYRTNVRRARTHDGEGVIYVLSSVRMPEIVDGTSKTFLIGESDCIHDDDPSKAAECESASCNLGRSWCFCNQITTGFGINNRQHGYFNDADVQSWHPGVANFMFVDGHVQSIHENIELPVLIGLTTRDESLNTGRQTGMAGIEQSDIP
jgi:prepilin-type processing-associated H-X9-DG protein